MKTFNRAMFIRLATVIAIGIGVIAPVMAQDARYFVPSIEPPSTTGSTDAEDLALDMDEAKFNIGWNTTLNKACKLNLNNAKVMIVLAQMGLTLAQAQKDPTIQRAMRQAKTVYANADKENREEICSGAWQSSDYLRP